MRRLDELVAEFCPDGVEYRPLGDMCYLVTKQTGFDYSKHIKDRLLTEEAEGAIPYMQTKFFSGHSFNYDTDYYVPNDIVTKFPKITLDERCLLFSIVGASIGNVGLFPAVQKCFLGGAICVAKIKPEHNVDYLYYCVESHDFQRQIVKKTKGPQATITVGDIRKFKVPVPPPEVQNEIVRILDNFTEIKTALVTALTKELATRRKQFDYYHNNLLFNSGDIVTTPLDELCYVSAGGDVPKEKFSKEKTDEYTVPILSNGVGDNSLYGYTNQAKIIDPAVTVAARGTIGYAEYRDYPYHPIIRLLSVIPKDLKKMDTKYLYYCLKERNYNIPTTGIPQLTVPMLKKTSIPLITMDRQKEIVEVLDLYSDICSKINGDLSSEIEARQKQYEYYRDKLLTFPELKQ